jgi:prepilin-type N-terminal cleavage/methylation domain-containing protein
MIQSCVPWSTSRLAARSLRSGLSLLEVLLALAVLGMTLAIIGELTRIGSRSAEQARDVSTAQIHCESVMAQVVAGLIAPTPVGDIPLDDPNAPGEWLYAIESQQVDQAGMLAVKVTVSQNPQVYSRPVAFALGRWMIDPMQSTTTTGSSATAGTTASY